MAHGFACLDRLGQRRLRLVARAILLDVHLPELRQEGGVRRERLGEREEAGIAQCVPEHLHVRHPLRLREGAHHCPHALGAHVVCEEAQPAQIGGRAALQQRGDRPGLVVTPFEQRVVEEPRLAEAAGVGLPTI